MKNMKETGRWLLLIVALAFIFTMAWITLQLVAKIKLKSSQYEQKILEQTQPLKPPANVRPVE